MFFFYEMECPQQGSNLKVHPYPFVLNIGRFTFDSSYRSNNVVEATRIRNAIKRFEQTKVANEDSASKMLGGTRMQRIIVAVTPNWQLSTVSQLLTRSSQISAITPQIQSQYPFVLNIPMAQLWRGLIPYTVHPGFVEGAPNVPRASWCPGEGTACAHLPTING